MSVKLPSRPMPIETDDCVLLAHGEGGMMTRRLIHELLLAELDNEYLRQLSDGAVLPAVVGKLVMSTDSYVVSPIFFPGGDIGKLAVHGTLNDLAVSGADPLHLSLAMILEEGLPFETLRRVVRSIKEAAAECGIGVVTGDTKVVPRGAADGIYLNTTGIGRLRPDVDLGADRVRPGDVLLVNGTIGDHGIAVLAARKGLDFGTEVPSDTAPLHGLIRALFDSGARVHFLRDATRGGVAAVLHELTSAVKLTAVVDEAAVPVSDVVRGACSILGLDPLYIANEGKLVAVVDREDAATALNAMRAHPVGRSAAIVGEIREADGIPVQVRGELGALRVLDEPRGAPLPRIC